MMKRVVVLLLAFVLSMGGTVAAMNIWDSMQEPADVIIAGEGAKRYRDIYLDKEVYVEGEPINVTVNTHNPLDRVMVYRDGEFTNRLAYWRVGAVRDGESEDLLGAGVNNPTNALDYYDSNYAGSGDATFTPGRYAAVLLDYTGSFNAAVLKYVYFTVVAAD